MVPTNFKTIWQFKTHLGQLWDSSSSALWIYIGEKNQHLSLNLIKIHEDITVGHMWVDHVYKKLNR